MPKLTLISDARPVASDGDGLTAMQRAFVTEYTSGQGCVGNGTEAARRAGYTAKYPSECARQLLQKPHIREAIERENREAISGRISTKAVALLERTIDDESAPLKIRVQASLGVLDRGGYTPPSAFEKAAAFAAREHRDKPLHMMTHAELKQRLTALSGEITDREAPTLDGEASHVGEADPSQV
jgi:hypothetical protein